jgi:hypothetical protein
VGGTPGPDSTVERGLLIVISQLRREERYSYQKLLHRRSAYASNFLVDSGDDENAPLVGLWWKFTRRSGKGFY